MFKGSEEDAFKEFQADELLPVLELDELPPRDPKKDKCTEDGLVYVRSYCRNAPGATSSKKRKGKGDKMPTGQQPQDVAWKKRAKNRLFNRFARRVKELNVEANQPRRSSRLAAKSSFTPNPNLDK